MPKRISLTPQQRGELVLRLLRKEATADELAREQSISENTLYKWRAAFLEAGFGGLGETRGPATPRFLNVSWRSATR